MILRLVLYFVDVHDLLESSCSGSRDQCSEKLTVFAGNQFWRLFRVTAAGNSAESVSRRTEEVVIHWRKVRRVGRVLENLSPEILESHFC